MFSTEEQQTPWTEFFLRGDTTGRIRYFNRPNWQGSVKKGEYNDFVCVDGLQRLTVIKRSMNGKISASGSYINEYEEETYLTRSFIKVNVNNLKTEKSITEVCGYECRWNATY